MMEEKGLGEVHREGQIGVKAFSKFPLSLIAIEGGEGLIKDTFIHIDREWPVPGVVSVNLFKSPRVPQNDVHSDSALIVALWFCFGTIIVVNFISTGTMITFV